MQMGVFWAGVDHTDGRVEGGHGQHSVPFMGPASLVSLPCAGGLAGVLVCWGPRAAARPFWPASHRPLAMWLSGWLLAFRDFTRFRLRLRYRVSRSLSLLIYQRFHWLLQHGLSSPNPTSTQNKLGSPQTIPVSQGLLAAFPIVNEVSTNSNLGLDLDRPDLPCTSHLLFHNACDP